MRCASKNRRLKGKKWYRTCTTCAVEKEEVPNYRKKGVNGLTNSVCNTCKREADAKYRLKMRPSSVHGPFDRCANPARDLESATQTWGWA